MLGEGQEEKSFNCCKKILAEYRQAWNPGKSLPGDLVVPSPETVKHMTGKYLSRMSGYVQTCLTAGGWTRPAINSTFLMFSARFIAKGPVTGRPWCQPRPMSVTGLVPGPNFCCRWTKWSLLVSSWPVLLRLLWNPYSWKWFFPLAPWTSALFLTTRNVKTFLFLFQ